MSAVSEQIGLMKQGGSVQRFHTWSTIKQQTVGEHSFGVAMFVAMMGGDYAELMAALVHDLPEAHTGDIPAPAKRLLDKTSLENLERKEEEILINAAWLVNLSPASKRMLKLADCFDGMLFCIKEKELGNQSIGVVFSRYRKYVVEHYPLNELESEIFMELKNYWSQQL